MTAAVAIEAGPLTPLADTAARTYPGLSSVYTIQACTVRRSASHDVVAGAVYTTHIYSDFARAAKHCSLTS